MTIKNFIDDQAAIETIAREVASHRHFSRCGGVVPLLEIYEDSENVYIFLELQQHGTLLGKIHSINELFTERKIWFMMIQLLLSVDFIHKKGFMHRDIKPENILVNDDHKGYLKLLIADLGLVTKVPENPRHGLFEICGTPCYVAPEVLNNIGYREQVDIFSIGSVFFNLLTGMYLFKG